MSQINYKHPWPFPWETRSRPFGATDKTVTMHEAHRLWWLPKIFSATVTVDCPYGAETFDFTYPGTAGLRRQFTMPFLLGIDEWAGAEEERNLCYPGLGVDLGLTRYNSVASYTGEVPDDAGTYANLQLKLFVPFLSIPPGYATGLSTDVEGIRWQVRTALEGEIAFPDVTAVIGHMPEGGDGVSSKLLDPAPQITYKPEPNLGPNYTHPPNIATYLGVSTSDVADWDVTIEIEEAIWFEHHDAGDPRGPVFSETAGTNRLRAPGAML